MSLCLFPIHLSCLGFLQVHACPPTSTLDLHAAPKQIQVKGTTAAPVTGVKFQVSVCLYTRADSHFFSLPMRSLRKAGDRVAVWTRNADKEACVNEIGDQFRSAISECLEGDVPAGSIEYHVHNDALRNTSPSPSLPISPRSRRCFFTLMGESSASLCLHARGACTTVRQLSHVCIYAHHYH